MSKDKTEHELAPLEGGFGAHLPRAGSAGSSDGFDSRYSPPASQNRSKSMNVSQKFPERPTSTLLRSDLESDTPKDSAADRTSALTFLTKPWRSLRHQLPEGWRFGATVGAALSLCTLVGNIIVVVIAAAVARRENGHTSAISVIRKGNCGDIEYIGLAIHLVINVVSTLILGASNYCMQCLSAPTRADVDGAHQKGAWLDIGVPSLRNLRFIGPTKLAYWLILGLSSLPLHLFYNSTFFVSLNNNAYDVYYASNEFPAGGSIEEKVFPNPPSDVVDSYSIDAKARANFTFHLPDGTNKSWEMTLDYQTKPSTIQSSAGNLGVSKNGSYFERLNNSDCIQAYAQTILPSRRNLVLVVSNSPRNNPEIHTVPYNIETDSSTETFYQSCANSSGDPIRTMEMGLVSCSQNSSLYAIDSYSNSLTPVASQARYVWFSWICSQVETYAEYDLPGATCSDGAWQTVRANSSRWSVYGYDVEYCISEVVEDQCRLNVAINLLVVVIVFNAVKVIVIALVIWKIRDRPIITIGDAAELFIRQPDITTKGMCLLTQTDASKRSSKNVQFAYGIVQPKAYKMERKRRGSAASKARWAAAMILTSIALIIILCLLGYAMNILKTKYDRGDAKSLLELGLGKASPFTLIRGWNIPQTGDGAIVATVLIANLPQLILSFLYVIINGLFTSLSLAAEWSRYAHERRALRVSHPRGSQRSTYFLQVPYRLGIPLMCFSAFLHWIISQSIFVAKVDGMDPTGTPQDVSWGSGAITCGYSPLGMIITVVAAFVLMVFVGILGGRKLKPGMPMVGSCSVAISAACHVPEGTSEYLPVMWGAISDMEEERGDGVKVGHCAFSNEHVDVPIEGRLYS